MFWFSDGVPASVCILWKHKYPSSLDVVFETYKKNPAIFEVYTVGPIKVFKTHE